MRRATTGTIWFVGVLLFNVAVYLTSIEAKENRACESKQAEGCPKQSDAVGCNVTCGPDQFACASCECIPELYRCDGDKDCGDGSDELKCDEEQCEGETSSKCRDGTRDCKNGIDKLNCSPPNTNTRCSGTECIAAEGRVSFLFAQEHAIRGIVLDRTEKVPAVIVKGTKAATALDFEFSSGLLFWSDMSDKKIYKTPIEKSNERTVVVTDISADGLAVDWIYKNIYYSNINRGSIEVSNFDGTMSKVLIRKDLVLPRAVAVDPINGWLYWSDWGLDPRIERAGMDGSNRQAIVTEDVGWPNGITLDLVLRRVYWVDAKLNTLSSCNYDGTDRRLLLQSPNYLRHPFSITTCEDWVYWGDWDKKSIFKADKFTGRDVQLFTSLQMEVPRAIQVYQKYRQPNGTNHCLADNGHCSHLCLAAPQFGTAVGPRISCACPIAMRLAEDGHLCTEETSIEKYTPSGPFSIDNNDHPRINKL